MKIYCTKCGQPTDYTLLKPNFCASCGNSFNPVATAKAAPEPKPTKKIVAKRPIDDDDDDDTFEGEVPKIEKFKYTVEIHKPIQETVGSIAGTQTSQAPVRDEGIKLSREEILAQFKKEASAIRNK